jgi:hypothetical protein
MQDDQVVTIEQWLHGLYAIEINYGGTMNSYKELGVELGFHVGDRLADQVVLAADMQFYIVSSRRDPVDIADGYKDRFP